MGFQGFAKKGLPMVVSTMLIASFLLGHSPAYGGGTLLETFTNNTYDQNWWYIGTQGIGPSTAVTNNHLEITIPANASSGGSPSPFGGFINGPLLAGDFDVQVDFTLVTWSVPAGVQMGILPVFPRGAVRFTAGVDMMSDPDFNPAQFYGDFSSVSIPTLDNAGKLRLKRTGTTIEAFYWASSGWQPISGPRTDAQFWRNCAMQFYVYSHNFQGKDVKVAFDNLQIIYTRITSGNNPSTVGALLPLLLQ
ncbi:MAG: hypothetical protein NTY36_03945 [Deltaproteobacteria bacterium]|nr:hypothetical protein [Deltaproteobacteria bacterium]